MATVTPFYQSPTNMAATLGFDVAAVCALNLKLSAFPWKAHYSGTSFASCLPANVRLQRTQMKSFEFLNPWKNLELIASKYKLKADEALTQELGLGPVHVTRVHCTVNIL